MTFVDQGDHSCFDDFTMVVVGGDEIHCYIDVYEDGFAVEAGQNDPATFNFIYRGANTGSGKTGNEKKDTWNIFWYNRSDASPPGTPASPLSSLPTITEPVGQPNPGMPSLNADEKDYLRDLHNGVPGVTQPANSFNGYTGNVDNNGNLQAYWKDSFTSTVPDEGTDQDEVQANEQVTFTGRCQIH